MNKAVVTGGFMKIIIILVIGFLSFNIYAEEADPVAEAQAILTSRLEREKIMKTDKKAKSADDFADRAVGGNQADKDELYNISAEAIAHLVKTNGGDADKMQEHMLKAIQNPEAFKKSLPVSIQNKMNAVVNRVESRSPASVSKP
jgi:hypothetical protein